MKNRLEYLDALRGIAAFSVCIHHALGRLSETLPPTHPFSALIREKAFDQIDLGRFGVVLFFLISGFIIPNSLKPGVPVQKFVVGRLFRLYPAYWVTCMLILVTLPYIGIMPIGVGQFLASLTMVPTFFRQDYISGIFWTLFIEILFYCCCVALFTIKSLNNPIIVGVGAVLLNLATPLAIVLNKLLHLHLPMLFVLNHLSFLFMGNTLRLAITQHNDTAKKLSFYLLLQVMLTVPLVTGCFFAVPEVTAAKFVMFRAEGNALGYFLAIGLFIVSVNYKFSMGKLWVWLGVVSYSLYLMHLLCFDFLLLAIPVDNLSGAVSYFTLGLLTSCLLAKLSYSFIEHPAIELGKKIIHSRKIAEPI